MLLMSLKPTCNQQLTITLNIDITDGTQFIFSDRETLLFNREDYNINGDTIKIIVKGFNNNNTLDNIKLACVCLNVTRLK